MGLFGKPKPKPKPLSDPDAASFWNEVHKAKGADRKRLLALDPRTPQGRKLRAAEAKAAKAAKSAKAAKGKGKK